MFWWQHATIKCACANLCECFILDGEKPVKMINCVVAPVPWKIRYPLTKFFEHLFSTQHNFAAATKSLQSCPTLCDPRDGSPPGSPIPDILQARTLEWVAISFSNAWKWKVKSEVAQSCLTQRPMDCSLPGSSVPWGFPGKSTGVGCHCLLRIQF